MLAIGVDSGGTHTTCVFRREDGPSPDSAATSASISQARGEGPMEEAADWICHTIADQADDEVCVWIGAAGYTGASAEWIRRMFQRPLRDLARLGKQCDIFIANDAVSILKAPPLMGRGVAAIVGTGSVVMGVHPECSTGVVKRGGSEWLVSDEGAGVWMTLQAIRLLLRDVQLQGGTDYQSPLLDRLCDYFGIEADFLADVPPSHKGLARAELLAAVVAEGRADAKRRIAGFVYPHLFDLAVLQAGRPHDRVAAEVLASSVELIAQAIDEVSAVLAAHTSDAPTNREKLAVTVGGNIAAHPTYAQQLTSAVSKCAYVHSIDIVGDASGRYAELAWHYLNAPAREQRAIRRNFDPIHTVTRLA